MSSMKVAVGIDLGSTTTKSVILNEAGQVIGRGITNSRSNYDVACQVAREEAFVQARLSLMRNALNGRAQLAALERAFLSGLMRHFRHQQHLARLESLRQSLDRAAEARRHHDRWREIQAVIAKIVDAMAERSAAHYGPLAVRKSDFFRDLAAADYMQLAEQYSDPKGVTFEALCGPV